MAADGVHSSLREERSSVFLPVFDVHGTRYIWLGLPLRLPAFTFSFQPSDFGMFQAHAYPFAGDMSTVIVECTESTWRTAGLDRAREAESLQFCQDLFGDLLHGETLRSNRSTWTNFVTLRNDTWHDGNLVLLGDAAHTAHFSIGSGTKMAMEDAIALSRAIDNYGTVHDALVAYEELRQPIVERTQQAARASAGWFEQVARYARFAPPQFAFSLLTRSTRITYDKLRLRDPKFSDRVDSWFAAQSGNLKAGSMPTPRPVSVPLRLSGRILRNRWIAYPPACDDGVDGVLSQGALIGIRALADAGAAVVMARDVAIAPMARINPGCAVLNAESRAVWTEFVEVIHAQGALAGVQVGHAGPRGSTLPRTLGVDMPLRTGGWPLLAATDRPYSVHSSRPSAATADEIQTVVAQFADAARKADTLRIDLLELDFSHGYLLATFISPLTNRRTDEYGGSLEHRLRFPLDVLRAVRRVWPTDRILSVRYSVSDWAIGGITPEEAIQTARTFSECGADCIHVASGQTTVRANPPYGSAWEAGISDLVRNEAQIPTMVGGYIRSEDEANTILAAGRADLYVSGGSLHGSQE
ncbi:MAG: FAD-dependent monooxygenase [Chloroflexota bacterium]